jgi:capsular polysaccharide biosynthesis protein
MELKQYARIIKNEKKLILTLMALTALAALGFTYLTPVHYEASVSLFLDRDGTQATDQFKYDGYYALQAKDLVASNVEKMLQSPQLVDAIYRQSAVDPSFRDIKSYKQRFTAHKLSSDYVEVGFTSKSRDDAGKLGKALVDTVNQELRQEKDTSSQEIAFFVQAGDPVILEKMSDPLENGVLGLISGLFLGTFIAFLKHYLA